MTQIDRRKFLAQLGSGAGALVLGNAAEASAIETSKTKAMEPSGAAEPQSPAVVDEQQVDFRYSPNLWQTAICFPDDSYKTIVGDRGDLRYGFDRWNKIRYFPLVYEFSLAGMEEREFAGQYLEAPHLPIVITDFRTGEVGWRLVAFASNRTGEGRVDNVLLEIRPASNEPVNLVPQITVRTVLPLKPDKAGNLAAVRRDDENKALMFCVDRPNRGISPLRSDGFFPADSWKPFEFQHMRVMSDKVERMFIRIPQQGQTLEKLQAGLSDPDGLLNETRQFWKAWKAIAGKVTWSIPGKQGEFLTACARNILQAREVRDGRLTFQVGATDYRGLWIVDGNFILEAARYLGYDEDAQKGLEATWAQQREDGSIFAGAGEKHWKDTAIAMFTIVRQAELSQDWSYFQKMQQPLLRAIKYLSDSRTKAVEEGSANGKYGLPPRGMPDGGLLGARSEFTNTVWTLAALKAVAEAAEKQKLADMSPARKFYDELRAAFDTAAVAEKRRHPGGFEYLPMLMKEDKQWSEPDEWERPRPQAAQWALSHAIFPGEVFAPGDWITQGHIALMQSCTQEDIPAETGWAPHGSVWTYNAAFVAQVYLWAGMADWARRTFIGFLNHASPLYCWREEQPLHGSLVGKFIGDMPHNWASAECIRYLRHMLALETGNELRLLAGISQHELDTGQAYESVDSPTRFGRITVRLEPGGGGSWGLTLKHEAVAADMSLVVPARLGDRLQIISAPSSLVRRGNHFVIASPPRQFAISWR